MRILNIAVFVFSMLLFSCKNERRENKANEDLPQAFNDNASQSSSVNYKRYDNENIFQNLYDEVVSKSPKLKKLEEQIANLPKEERDSTQAFDNFTAKNQQYFSAVNTQIDMVKDSVIKQKIKKMIADNIAQYKSSIAADTLLLHQIDDNKTKISDLHFLLKTTLTLPLLEKYQKENHPKNEDIKQFILHQNKTIKQLEETITK